MTARDGFRCSSAVAYLNSTYKRANLDILTDCYVARVLLQETTSSKVLYKNPVKRASRGFAYGPTGSSEGVVKMADFMQI